MKNKEIICIDDSKPINPDITSHFKQWIVKNKIYTIRKIQQNFEGSWGLLLEEVVNPSYEVKLRGQVLGTAEPGFNLNRFRYLDDTPVLATVEVSELVKNN